jgi:hypothetical protein
MLKLIKPMLTDDSIDIEQHQDKLEEHKINPTPLRYKEINKDIKNILLIDVSVAQSDILFNSVNSNTLGIMYSNYSERDELIKLLTDNFKTIDRIGFVFNDALINSKQFLNSELFFTPEDSEYNKVEFSLNIKFLLDLIKNFKITNIDFLVCNGLKYDNWVKYFNLLNKETGVIVGASDNETGNLKYGGDWMMESTNEDITNIYWNSDISNYTSTLVSSIISTSTALTNVDLNNSIKYTWPIIINGGTSSSPVVITFSDDITLNSVSNYFIIGSEYITVDGLNNNVIIDSVLNYQGLFLNGTGTSNGYSNITIQNINLVSLNYSSLVSMAGWICHRYYSKSSLNCILNNLSSSGNMNVNRTGGICGQECARDFGNLKITNCYSTGIISGFFTGGICSGSAGFNGGSVEITNCWSTGDITGSESGGICGAQAGFNGGSVEITNCWSTGDITGSESGGICGITAGQQNGNVKITNCYSTGIISGFLTGGICSGFAGFNGGSVEITNCWSTGDITRSESGGICGAQAGQLNGNVKITNCYSTGDINGSQSGGICGAKAGQQNGNVKITNCYSTGDINGSQSGGIAGHWFGYNSNNLNQITNCYSTGNINGLNSGGICGPEVGYNDIGVLDYKPIILISNCYTLGVISDVSVSGSICGGIGLTYKNIPIVNIENCYTLYGPIVSSTLKIEPVETNVFIEPSNTWSDINAKLYLLDTPTYNSSGSLINPTGSVWADINPTSNSFPWLFSTLGYSPYTTDLTTTFVQKVSAGNKSVPALDTTSGHVYTIIAINNNLPSVYPSITINSSTGQISVGQSTNGGTYLIKVLQQSNYTLTNFELIVPNRPNNNRCKEFCVRLKENEKFILRLNEVYSRYCLIEKYQIIKKPKHGCLSLDSKNKIVYTPNKNYIGRDEFVLKCRNLIPTLSIEITFKIKLN